MQKQRSSPCEGLLQQWSAKRELANYYMTALLRLSPDDPDALRRRRELSKKVFEAQLCYKHVDDQLQSCYREYGSGSINTPESVL
jgi:hypothetical protein